MTRQAKSTREQTDPEAPQAPADTDRETRDDHRYSRDQQAPWADQDRDPRQARARVPRRRGRGRCRPSGASPRYEHSPIEELQDLIRLDWDAMDARFEEDEQVFTRPRDPHTRVDILPSSRHVRVEVEGVTVAESTSPRLLFETGLPGALPAQDPRSAGPADPHRYRQPLPIQGPS
jgi:hypothetical protein